MIFCACRTASWLIAQGPPRRGGGSDGCARGSDTRAADRRNGACRGLASQPGCKVERRARSPTGTEDGKLRVAAPSLPGPPKISLFFSPLPLPFFILLSLSLGVFSLNFGGVFEGWDPEMYTFGVLGLSCEAPAALGQNQKIFLKKLRKNVCEIWMKIIPNVKGHKTAFLFIGRVWEDLTANEFSHGYKWEPSLEICQ